MHSVSTDDRMGKPGVLVLGIGNTLLSDEGIGVHVLRRLHDEYGDDAGIDFIDGGTLGFTLAAPIASAARLIVIDAAQLDAEPGTVRCFLDDDMDRFIGYARRSAHEIGLTDLMHITCLTGSLPQPRALVGIQPAHTGLGEQPTPAVAAALETACAEVRRLIGVWQS